MKSAEEAELDTVAERATPPVAPHSLTVATLGAGAEGTVELVRVEGAEPEAIKVEEMKAATVVMAAAMGTGTTNMMAATITSTTGTTIMSGTTITVATTTMIAVDMAKTITMATEERTISGVSDIEDKPSRTDFCPENV